MQNQTFKLSLKPNDYPPNVPIVYADQYDVGRVFVATVYDADGSLYNFNGETVTVVGTKPSGTGFSYTATASGNTVTFETTGQMTVVAGDVTCGIIIEKDGDRIGTLHFVLHVQRAALSSDTIIDSDDFGSIITDAVEEWMDEHGVVIDDQLETPGAAADAKATGDAIDELKSAFDYGCITAELKTALLQLASKVAYIDDDGQDYYDDLYDALYNRYWQVTNNLTNCTTSNESVQTIKGAAYSATITASTGYQMSGATVSITMGGTDITATAYSNGVISIPAVTGALVITISAAAKQVSSISAVYTQSGTVYDTDSLDSLKDDLVVTATYDDSSTAVIPAADYTLSGTLAEGTSTITVSYGGKTGTFAVTVTGWTLVWDYTDGGLPATVAPNDWLVVSNTANVTFETDKGIKYYAKSLELNLRPKNYQYTENGAIEIIVNFGTLDNYHNVRATLGTSENCIIGFIGEAGVRINASANDPIPNTGISANTDYTLRVERSATNGKVYLDGTLVYSGELRSLAQDNNVLAGVYSAYNGYGTIYIKSIKFYQGS